MNLNRVVTSCTQKAWTIKRTSAVRIFRGASLKAVALKWWRLYLRAFLHRRKNPIFYQKAAENGILIYCVVDLTARISSQTWTTAPYFRLLPDNRRSNWKREEPWQGKIFKSHYHYWQIHNEMKDANYHQQPPPSRLCRGESPKRLIRTRSSEFFLLQQFLRYFGVLPSFDLSEIQRPISIPINPLVSWVHNILQESSWFRWEPIFQPIPVRKSARSCGNLRDSE